LFEDFVNPLSMSFDILFSNQHLESKVFHIYFSFNKLPSKHLENTSDLMLFSKNFIVGLFELEKMGYLTKI